MQFGSHDLAALAAILRDAAVHEILPRFRRLEPGGVRAKSGPLDLVTDADLAAEARIIAACSTAFPGVAMVGEEAASASPDLIGELARAPFAITIDPIDGTSNFAAGLPLFGVMAAVVEKGDTVAAVILDPIAGSWSGALRGQGAWEHAQDGSVARLRVAAPASLAHMKGTVSWRFMRPALRDQVLQKLPRVAQAWDMRCAAHEYRMLIGGHAHFVMFNRLMPWDHLAGVLLHAEAGGYSAKFDGSDYKPGETTGGLLCAPDRASWHALHDALLPAPSRDLAGC